MGTSIGAQQYEDHLDMARLLFNFLRISPSYAAVSHYVKPTRIPKKMSQENRRLLASHSLYGDVHHCKFDQWMEKQAVNLTSNALPVIELITGKERLFVCDQDILLKVRTDLNPPTVFELAGFIQKLWPNKSAYQIKYQITKGVKLKNMWKDLLLIYVMARNPELELWRAGAKAMLVDRFIGKLDPSASKHKSSDDYMRRHMTLMAMRHKDYALHASEQAAFGNFPKRDIDKDRQTRFDFEDQNYNSRLFGGGLDELLFANQRVCYLTGTS